MLLEQVPDITAELFVEVLGTLANLYIPEFDFLVLVRKHNLLSFLATYAQVRTCHCQLHWRCLKPWLPSLKHSLLRKGCHP